jgi:putative Mg2+ transporter-C (MgtC) family protein
MPLTITLQQIALRIFLALVASFLIGYDRDEHGKTSGIRTTMLVCLAATLAMLQANLLMDSTGKAHDSFVVLDLMRLPLGILSGIGFIGAGAILRKDGLVHGLTTAATLWFITVLGLLFGGGQLSRNKAHPRSSNPISAASSTTQAIPSLTGPPNTAVPCLTRSPAN